MNPSSLTILVKTHPKITKHLSLFVEIEKVHLVTYDVLGYVDNRDDTVNT